MSEVKKPVFFFHGFWGQASDFDFLKASSINYDVQSIEYTQHEFLSPENFISDWGHGFWRWVDENKIQTPLRAVGYSQGGRLLLQAFALAPERFESLVLISSHPGLQSFQEKEQRLSHDRKWAQDFRTLDWSTLQSTWNSQGVFVGGKDQPRLEKDFDRDLLALCFENWSLAHQSDFRELIRKHTDKIKVILGSEDSKYLKLYEDAKISFQKAKGAAHRVPSDQPLILAEVLNSIF